MTAPVSTKLSAEASTRASEWLPDNALVAAAAVAAIDARVAAWSARWFAQPIGRREAGGTPAAVAVRPMPRLGWRRFGSGIWLDWGENTPQTLALHALGRAELRPKLTSDDGQLLDKLGERLARDLAASLLKSAAPPLAEHDNGPTRAVCFKLGSASQNLGLAVAIDAAVLAGLRKQLCSPCGARDAQPRPLGTVLASVPVAFEVALGSVTIGLLEFETIETGDTIVLDQSVSAPLAMRATVTGAAIRNTKLVREDGQLTLTAS